MGKLDAKAFDPGAMDSQLHVMDLVETSLAIQSIHAVDPNFPVIT
jgi:hypothetical protein